MVVSETSLNSANGVATSVHQLLRYFEKVDIDAQVVAPKPLDASYYGFPTEGIKSIEMRGFNVGVPSPKKLEKIHNKFQPDVVHVASPFGPLGERAIAAANVSVAVFQTDTSQYLSQLVSEFLPSTELPRKLMEKITHDRLNEIHAAADLTLVPSQASWDMLVEKGIDENKLAFWRRGVDGETFNPEVRFKKSVQKLRQELSQTGRPIVGYIGRLAPEKSVERLKELADLDCEIVVVGDGPSKNSVVSALGSRAIMLGELSGKKLAQAYGALDIFVHTGKFETFGQTIQEAQASGLPVVAPERGGPIDLIDDGKTGLLYHPEDSESLRRSVERLIGDRALRFSLGVEARASIEPRTWDALCRELIEVHYPTAMQNAGY